MAIDGHYTLTLDTPLGEQSGELTLKTEGAGLSGSLANSAGTSEFSGGTIDRDEVAFDTRIPTPIGRLKAHVTGKVSGDHFTGDAKLPLGSAHMEGVRD
ncbi:MAG: hypothetical protein PVJ80_09690 [Gemmatimonadota bacterium]|jgi:hypothetical protein